MEEKYYFFDKKVKYKIIYKLIEYKKNYFSSLV